MSRKIRFRKSLIDLWKIKRTLPMNPTRRSNRRTSAKTQRDRYAFMCSIVEIIHGDNYRISHYKNFDTRHLRVIVNHLETCDYAPSTMQNKLSMLRMLCKWIQKDSMIPMVSEMLMHPERYMRSGKAKRDRSWTPEVYEKAVTQIVRSNPSMAISLLLMDAFGLRIRESMLLRPEQDHEDEILNVYRGTKGGRARDVELTSEYQLKVLKVAKAQAKKNGGSMIPRKMRLATWRNRFYARLHYLGITLKDEGFTCHGLRHGYAQQLYQELTGGVAPIRENVPHDMEVWYKARENALLTVVFEVMVPDGQKAMLSAQLGHAREEIIDAYIGG